ncbi:hypothetical protein EK21DRAFT_117367 [Setomelanomma holmii]|uniref:Uncharacterized protein n=1 Tax=Setomelanomma holmii TaxID=210430 RepID=A0A9P4GZI9_9PLEO|nr:hypothetical protein EK21DRAFT_117367 [Setomelanomma holmii]
MASTREISPGFWSKTKSHLPSSSAFSAAKSFIFEPKPYDIIWSAIFKTEEWLECGSAKQAHIVLIGAGLDMLSKPQKDAARPHIVLTVYDRAGDLQYENNLFRSSFRGRYNGPGVYELDQLTITVGKFDVPEILEEDFHHVFSENSQQRLQTKYCYWKDPMKSIRTLDQKDARGVGGPISNASALSPIFLLNLRPPIRRLPSYFRALRGAKVAPEQHIFRLFGGDSFRTGNPPLVKAILGDKSEYGEYTFDGFAFKDKKYEKYEEYERQDEDWAKAAREECELQL